MSHRARIQEVAEAAGVSLKTVSRVLNKEPNVRPETRERVEAAVRELNYRPSSSARSLAGQRSFVIALLYDNPSKNYLMEILLGVLDACEENGYHMVLLPMPKEAEKFAEAVDALIAHSRPDGLILTPPITDNAVLLERIRALALPFASVSPKDASHAIGVIVDERRAAFDIVTHLVHLGHRRIAHVRGHPDHGAAEWRWRGYLEAMAAGGVAVDPLLVVEGAFSYDSGVAAANKLLALAEPPTAIFAANDDMAAGAIRAAFERGLSVPRDVSICGFDDSPMSSQIFPSLTTVRQPGRDMGRASTLELLRAIREPGTGSMVRIDYVLQLRNSTGVAPRRG